ncbi:MAG: hypothetical protein IJ298_11020 [Ruminococcus sp.]|nr:hypothetical protein [Ruminococcus sp.]
MGKALGSWSGMRKYLEQEMLAESLKGRVRYNCTSYKNTDNCKIFEIFIDGNISKQFSFETVNTYFIDMGYKEDSALTGLSGYWDGFFTLLQQYPATERTEYTDEEFCETLETYRNQDIQESIQSDNPLVRMFAILDRRLGKRTLQKLKDKVNLQPEWLKQFYNLRLSENS